MEAALLGLFMLSASFFATLLGHPASPVGHLIASPLERRALMGLAMGTTFLGLVFSPWGKQSGAHMNPSVTLTFLRLGKVAPQDALFYVLAQFAGGLIGIATVALVAGSLVGNPSIRYLATVPDKFGSGLAFAAEAVISFGMMLTVLIVSNSRSIARYTGFFAAALVVAYITIEAPLSGMSMNPARSFGPALVARLWDGLWIYFSAPPLGMLAAAQTYLLVRRGHPVLCAKLHHENHKRCIFRCGYGETSTSFSETSRASSASQERCRLDRAKVS